MKKICLIIGLAITTGVAMAQVGKPPQPSPPQNRATDNPYQFPNYYQNNSSYTNNSMQNNKPATPNAGPYTGNGDYADPTRNVAPPPIYNSNSGTLPAQPQLNNPNLPGNTDATIYKK
jgi:hypothetical protein